MTFLNIKNRAKSTLASGISDSDLSLIVFAGEGAKFPTSNFHITIEDEILLCTSRTDDVFTVVREREGTTAAVHSVSTKVQLRVTAQIIKELQDAIDAAPGLAVEILDDLSAQCNGSNLVFITTEDIRSIKFGVLEDSILTEGYQFTKTGDKEITMTYAPTLGEKLYLKYVKG